MDIIEQLGELAIGSRLRRLSDYIMNDGIEVYKSFKIDFDPRCFPVYYVLSQRDKMSVMEIAAALNTVHPTVIKQAKQLEKLGYIESSKDKRDGRKRILSLSNKGKALLPEIKLAWNDIAQSLNEMLSDHKHHILNAIMNVESSFANHSFLERAKQIREQRLLNDIEILDYDPKYGELFKSISYAWIEEYFTIESVDIDELENHQKNILDKGGVIIFAKVDGKIAGTCALVNFGNGVYELSKMGVLEKFKGKQVGKKLGLAILDRAKDLDAKTVFLESNKSLGPALNLYRKLGFIELAGTTSVSDYERCNIRMEVNL